MKRTSIEEHHRAYEYELLPGYVEATEDIAQIREVLADRPELAEDTAGPES